MTRKEIEKRCREAMEQNLPDKDALWMRIERSLPEQSAAPAAEEKPKRKISVIYRTVAAAACFLFVAGGVMLIGMSRIPHKDATENAMPAPAAKQDVAGEMAEELAGADDKMDPMQDEKFKSGMNAQAPAEADMAIEAEMAEENTPRDEEQFTIRDIQVPQHADVAAQTDRSKLHAAEEAFDEQTVLAATNMLVRAEVLSGTQDAQTGVMHYTLALQDCYNTGEQPDAEFTLENSSPYLLEAEHVYILPLQRTEDGWALSYADAPQIEVTLDGKLLCHSGWTSLLQSGSTHVVCEPQTADDRYYDKMYLTGSDSVDPLINVWALMQ